LNVGKGIDQDAVRHQFYANCAANTLLLKLSMALEPSEQEDETFTV
jgi:hypothetical protein